MPITNKALAVTSTTTTTTALLTAGGSETIRVTHVIASCTGTGGTFSLSVYDNSATVTGHIWQARAIAANSTLEVFDLFLEPNDQLRGGHATLTGGSFLICYQVES